MLNATVVDWANGILQEPIEIKGGHLQIPARPGMGIEWNEEVVRRRKIT